MKQDFLWCIQQFIYIIIILAYVFFTKVKNLYAATNKIFYNYFMVSSNKKFLVLTIFQLQDGVIKPKHGTLLLDSYKKKKELKNYSIELKFLIYEVNLAFHCKQNALIRNLSHKHTSWLI